jgi:catechol 2,3-dioxygenase-like lactoylglutathione lyase family enzyme
MTETIAAKIRFGRIAAMLPVADIDAFHAVIRARDLRIVKGLRDKVYGLRAFVFEDPDGNRIDVGEPLKR